MNDENNNDYEYIIEWANEEFSDKSSDSKFQNLLEEFKKEKDLIELFIEIIELYAPEENSPFYTEKKDNIINNASETIQKIIDGLEKFLKEKPESREIASKWFQGIIRVILLRFIDAYDEKQYEFVVYAKLLGGYWESRFDLGEEIKAYIESKESKQKLNYGISLLKRLFGLDIENIEITEELVKELRHLCFVINKYYEILKDDRLKELESLIEEKFDNSICEKITN